ncbi:MAG: acyl-CoA dehydrogenase family protein [Candidatus Rokubacteria bacterium]|nr:acyl-CoA dehydrogenase family protein [Candidatus Rokubacteria bacterium]
MDRIEHGRALLRRWHELRPTSFWETDAYLRATLAFRLGAARLAEAEPALRQAGADSAGPIDALAGELDRAENLPRLDTWNAAGERVEQVRFHPAHHDVGRLVWRSGLLAALGQPGGMTLHAGLTYLFGLHGEVPHLCSVACTAGLIKAIVRAGSERMRREWLPRLLDPDYDRRWHAAQFLTEVQGGSDVGANACVARPADGEHGAWRLSGEKWFCSNVGADLYAMSARPDGAPAGTAGLGLFVVPRQLPDGRPNGIRIRRLKSKLGTRTLPTAEVDFDGAVAWPLGRLEDGFKLMMGVIINTSRVEVAIGTAAIMQRAWLEASRYAAAREAFGRPLVVFPGVRQQLAEMRALAAAALASTLWVTSLEDRLARDGVAPEESALFRTAVTVNKYACSSDAGLVVHHAIEILGGNGTIEDFSPLPRLYREVPVQESWEGPHGTLMAQFLRDALRSKMHDALLGAAEDLLLAGDGGALAAVRARALRALEDVRAQLQGLLRGDADEAAYHVRPLVGRLARIVQVALLLEQAARDRAGAAPGWLPAAAELLLARWVEPGAPATSDARRYPALVDELVRA